MNRFMYVPVEADGRMTLVGRPLRAGDSVLFRPTWNALAVTPNCPPVHNRATAYKPTPIRVHGLD
jgi:uncharacterized protein YcgI (DUF1989 family)